MKRVAIVVAAGLVLCGCAADVGDTDLTLHQRAVFADGTTYELAEFKMSERDNARQRGPQKAPGPEVTVSLEVANFGKPLRASDLRMQLSYVGSDDQEVRPRELRSSSNVVPAGGRDRVSKTFLVRNVPEVFQTRYIRVVVEAPGYPGVTFRGSNP